MSEARTMREALVAELLGDLDGLTKRVEQLSETVPEVVDGAEGRLQEAAKGLTASGKENETAARCIEKQARQLETAAGGLSRSVQAAAEAQKKTRNLLWLMVPIAVLAGACAGGAAALLILRVWLG